MSAVWFAPLASQGEFAWATRFPERNSGQKRNNPVRILVREVQHQTGVDAHVRARVGKNIN